MAAPTSEENPGNEDRPGGRSSEVEVGGHIGSLRLLGEGARPYELRIDRDGRWFHEGIEIVRPEICRFFSEHLVRSEDGEYCVRVGRDECPVVVEDAPFVVVRVTEESHDSGSRGEEPKKDPVILLNDGRSEILDPATVVIKDSNVPYCRVRGDMEARFSRAAYYQLAEFIDQDEEQGKFYLRIGDRVIEIKPAVKE